MLTWSTYINPTFNISKAPNNNTKGKSANGLIVIWRGPLPTATTETPTTFLTFSTSLPALLFLVYSNFYLKVRFHYTFYYTLSYSTDQI
jgi:hypothetical protein